MCVEYRFYVQITNLSMVYQLELEMKMNLVKCALLQPLYVQSVCVFFILFSSLFCVKDFSFILIVIMIIVL